MLTTLYRRGYVSMMFVLATVVSILAFMTINIMFIACNGTICNISTEEYCHTKIPNYLYFIVYILSFIGIIISVVMIYRRNAQMKRNSILYYTNVHHVVSDMTDDTTHMYHVDGLHNYPKV